MADEYFPQMPAERLRQLREWHERAYHEQHASLPARLRFMRLDLEVGDGVFAPQADDKVGHPFHQTVEAAVRPRHRVLDMGCGSGVSALLASRAGAEVVAVDINPAAVECARANAARNGIGGITFAVSDVFGAVEGDFDLIVFDPPFRWFRPRDMLERASADENYDALRRFMTEAPRRLRPGGQILLNFGTTGDIDYLRQLADRARLARDERLYGEATRGGFVARYYTILLTVPHR